MAVQFILGASGTGKTTYIYEQMIAKSQEDGHEPIIFMLPEVRKIFLKQEKITEIPFLLTEKPEKK